MSLESAADDERREILELLDGRQPASQQSSQQQPRRNASPQPPIRSMLDVSSDAAPPRHGSIAGIGVGVTAPPNNKRTTTAPSANPNPGVRSLVDRAASPSPLRSSHSATDSAIPPVDGASGDGDKEHKDGHRRASDTANSIHPETRTRDHVDINQDYRFDMLPSIPNQALPKRVSQGGKKKHLKSNNSHNSSGTGANATHQSSMATVMSGSEFSPLPGNTRGRDLGRSNSTLVTQRRSKSPSSRASQTARSPSPGGNLLSPNSRDSATNPSKFVTGSGKVINMDHAYRRMSNAALSAAGGSLAHLPKGAATSNERGQSADSLSDGDSRVHKDYYSDTPEGGASEDYSTDEGEDTSSGDEDCKSASQRGRRRTRKKSDSEGNDKNDAAGGSNKKRPRVRSLLAAADEERTFFQFT